MEEKTKPDDDFPSAGTWCAACKLAGHFCQADVYSAEFDGNPICESCSHGEFCEVVKLRQKAATPMFEIDPAHEEIAPARSVPIPQMIAPAPKPVIKFEESANDVEAPSHNVERVVERVLSLGKGESASFHPPDAMTLFQFQFLVLKDLKDYPAAKFTAQKSPDGRSLTVKRVSGSAKLSIPSDEPLRFVAPAPENGAITVSLSSKEVAKKGIKTARDFVDFMGALMADVVSDRVDPQKAQAACAAADRMLKAVEMQRKYGLASAGDEELIPNRKSLGDGK